MSIFGEEILPSVPNAKHVSQISQRNRSFIFLTFRMHIIGTIGSNYFWDRNPSFTRYLEKCVGKYLITKPFLDIKVYCHIFRCTKNQPISQLTIGGRTLKVWYHFPAVYLHCWEVWELRKSSLCVCL